ncbi:GGDEF domain-containing protein [Desulfovibrio sp. TomC]|uniref:GGDEF domain-containing protein n=1 Tax=Desulfovibrio sp. TomC TaxID=1562888 RepID=UPI0005733C88|nr:GGDEF domain-containing protein [Desulfovibrio sp. TomC]KHK03979.1 EAL domain/GGDEF domain protein [Desulfovibrio sp. TomC]
MEWTNETGLYVKGALQTRPAPRSGQADGESHGLSGPAGLCRDLGPRAGADIGVVTVEIAEFSRILPEIDLQVGYEILRLLAEAVRDGFARHFAGCTVLRLQETGVAAYACFFSPRSCSCDGDVVLASFAAFRTALSETLSRRFSHMAGRQLAVDIGYARLDASSGGPDPRHILKALCQAQCMGKDKFDAERRQLYQMFERLLVTRELDVRYQPVVDLSAGGVLGWEVSLRGGGAGPFADPSHLWRFAAQCGEEASLDRVFRELALAHLGAIGVQQKLFLPIRHASLDAPAFAPSHLAGELERLGLGPANLVLCISEKTGPGELACVFERLEVHRGAGFELAADEVGGGASNLLLLSRTRPDWIKTWPGLTEAVEANPFKRVMLETLALLAEKIGARMVVGGVASELALSTVTSMGVAAALGPHFGAPACPKPETVGELPPKASFDILGGVAWHCSAPIGNLAEECLTVDEQTTVDEVKELLDERPPITNVVVASNRRPIGLVMNYHLDRRLSTRYGNSLFAHKSVTRIMNPSPLLAEASQAVEAVARQAMNREASMVYDDIVVVDGEGLLVGTVSVQKMLDSLAQVQVELAKGSNPLTGLPGNMAIEQEVNRRAKIALPISCVYVDLDHFKVYNDAYGFTNGDKVILLTARVLAEALRGRPDCFLGHVGGDDFVCITPREEAESLCRQTIEAFAGAVLAHYSPEDQARGAISGKARDGTPGMFPLVSLSMGIVDCAFEVPFSAEEFSQRVAEVKKFAKTRPGNSCVRDRRAPLGAKI